VSDALENSNAMCSGVSILEGDAETMQAKSAKEIMEREDEVELVDKAIDESFPASDPPAYNATPKREPIEHPEAAAEQPPSDSGGEDQQSR
jgi:hypothetical protein